MKQTPLAKFSDSWAFILSKLYLFITLGVTPFAHWCSLPLFKSDVVEQSMTSLWLTLNVQRMSQCHHQRAPFSALVLHQAYFHL